MGVKGVRSHSKEYKMVDTDRDNENSIRERIMSLLLLVARESVRRIVQERNSANPRTDNMVAASRAKRQGVADRRCHVKGSESI